MTVAISLAHFSVLEIPIQKLSYVYEQDLRNFIPQERFADIRILEEMEKNLNKYFQGHTDHLKCFPPKSRSNHTHESPTKSLSLSPSKNCFE